MIIQGTYIYIYANYNLQKVYTKYIKTQIGIKYDNIWILSN